MKMTSEQYRKFLKESQSKLNKLVSNRTTNNSKLNNKSSFYNGDRYDSIGEKEYAIGLDFRVKAKEIKGWSRQVKIELRVNDRLVSNYYIDFIIEHNDGKQELVEYKGFETRHFQEKWKLFLALAPEMFPGAIITKVKHKSKYKPK